MLPLERTSCHCLLIRFSKKFIKPSLDRHFPHSTRASYTRKKFAACFLAVFYFSAWKYLDKARESFDRLPGVEFHRSARVKRKFETQTPWAPRDQPALSLIISGKTTLSSPPAAVKKACKKP